MLARGRHEQVQRLPRGVDAAHEPQADEVRCLWGERLDVSVITAADCGGRQERDVLGRGADDGGAEVVGSGCCCWGERDDADDGAVEDGGERAGRQRFAERHDGEEVAGCRRRRRIVSSLAWRWVLSCRCRCVREDVGFVGGEEAGVPRLRWRALLRRAEVEVRQRLHVAELGGGAGGRGRAGGLGGDGLEARDGGGGGGGAERVVAAARFVGSVDDVGEREAGDEGGEDLEAGADDPAGRVDDDGAVGVAEGEVFLVVRHQVDDAFDEVLWVVLRAVGSDEVGADGSLVGPGAGTGMGERGAKDGLAELNEGYLSRR